VINSYQAAFMQSSGIDPDELLSTLEGLKYEDFIHFAMNVMKEVRFKWLVVGNLTEDIAKRVVQGAEETFMHIKHSSILKKSDVYLIRAIKFPQKITYWEKIQQPLETNSAFSVQFQH
jgi:secreted Zn-dependent insulinase-like peptidase